MSDFNSLIASIKDKFQDPLPGKEAQLKMAPVTRARMMEMDIDLRKARKAAVLILLFADPVVKTVLIQRQAYDGIHSNQVSFPGGKYETSDGTLKHTALRETCEEIGIRQEEIEVIGKLSELYIPPSNFNVQPYVGFVKEKPSFKPDNMEVKKVISVPLNILTDETIKDFRPIETSYQQRVKVPCFMIDGHIVWGATAMIISELVALIRA
jgi:8-oxo-dGTP pyrophosphatase MutT (NUDIX family)